MKGMVWGLLAIALGACGHERPFTTGPYVPAGPYAGGAPLRLTYDLGGDSAPHWFPDESGVLYSFERADRPDHDRCLAFLPVGGGSRTNQICHATGLSLDSIDSFAAPSLSPGGRLAYFRATDRLPFIARTFAGIGVGTLTAPESGPLLDNLPRNLTTDPAETATQIRWLSDSDLVYLALGLPQPPVVPWRPLALIRARLHPDSAEYEILVNTGTPTSVAVDGPDAIYYTTQGDTRVFHRVLSTDSTVVAHDFGSGRIPESVHVVGARLVAIVQSQIWLVSLADSSETLIPSPGLPMGLALAPSGARLAAALNIGGNVDLWMFDLP